MCSDQKALRLRTLNPCRALRQGQCRDSKTTKPMSLPVAKFFVKARVPYVLIPRGGKRVAARIARDFVELLTGFVERLNELEGSSLSVAEGLTRLLDSDVQPASLFSQYRTIAEQSRAVLCPWSQEKRFDE